MRIKAKQQFSHYHLGTFETGEERNVPDDAGEALVAMELAEEVAGTPGDQGPPEEGHKPDETPARGRGRGRAAQ